MLRVRRTFAVARVANSIGRQRHLDAVAEAASNAVKRVVPGGPAKDVLSGVWLGHPVHPMLTDLPIGFWTSAFVLDFLGGRRGRDAATTLVGLGTLSAVPAIAAGLSDWSDTTGAPRRVGLVHAAANAIAVASYTASWWSRRRGRHWRGVSYGLLGATAATVGGYLGGHLVQRLGVGVDNTAFETRADEWTRACAVVDVTNAPTCVDVAGAPVVVFRDHGELFALDGRCPHRGAPMAEGTIDGDVIVCPWHGSEFRIDDGSIERGPAAAPLASYECREFEGDLEVRTRS